MLSKERKEDTLNSGHILIIRIEQYALILYLNVSPIITLIPVLVIFSQFNPQ